MLTPKEHEALSKCKELAILLDEIVSEPGRMLPAWEQDSRELMSHLHMLQRGIMAQAAARMYPNLYRLLGDNG